jgi:hypothetical protein
VAYRLVDRSNQILIKLDKQFGKDATYHLPVSSTISPIGEVIIVYEDIPVKVRPAGLSALEMSRLSQSGLGQIDATWRMRHHYVADVQPDHVLQVGSFYYEIIDNGAELDALELCWTLYTRRRR